MNSCRHHLGIVGGIKIRVRRLVHRVAVGVDEKWVLHGRRGIGLAGYEQLFINITQLLT